MADKDKPTVHLSYSALDSETGPEPFVYTTSASRRVTFPDIYGMDAEAGEKLLMDARNMPDGEFLAKWLESDDLENLKADKLTLRQRTRLVQAAIQHYEKTMGDPGEGRGSGS